MKFLSFTFMVFCFCANGFAQTTVVDKLGMDELGLISPRIQIDSNIKTEGIGSVKIATRWPATIFLGEVTGRDLENTKVIYRAKVKGEGLDGIVQLEMWCHFGDQQYFSRGIGITVSEAENWKEIQTEFLLLKGQKPDKITLNVIVNGKGTLWIDEIVLEKI